MNSQNQLTPIHQILDFSALYLKVLYQDALFLHYEDNPMQLKSRNNITVLEFWEFESFL